MTIMFRGQDLQQDGLDLHLVSGFFEPPSVRGEDTVVPGRPGKIAGSREEDKRTLRLVGRVVGSTPEAWNVATLLLMSILNTTLDPGDLVLEAPYLGLAAGVTATITARTLNAIGGPILAGKTFQRWDAELENISGLGWVFT